MTKIIYIVTAFLALAVFPVIGFSNLSDSEVSGLINNDFYLGGGIAVGTRYQLKYGELFVPDYFQADGNKIDLFMHLHGAHWVAEDNLYKAKRNAVLVSIHIDSFAGKYEAFFKTQSRFQSILDEALSKLNKKNIVKNPEISFLGITSFSAGYGGVREILKVPKYVEMLDALHLADGLHCDYVNGHNLKEESLVMFLDFARLAALGEKIMIISHSQITPGTYASTTETADYLLSNLKLERTPWSDINDYGMQYTSIAEHGNFQIHAFTGNDAKAHMTHLYSIYLYLNDLGW